MRPSTQQSAAQMKWVSCTLTTSIQRFESYTSKHPSVLSHLYKQCLMTFFSYLLLLSIHDSLEILGRKNADGVYKRSGAEISGDSAVSRQSSDSILTYNINLILSVEWVRKTEPSMRRSSTFFPETGALAPPASRLSSQRLTSWIRLQSDLNWSPWVHP